MIKRIINDKPTIMGLLTPFSDINMSIREQPIMLLHQSLHSLTDTYCIDNCFHSGFSNVQKVKSQG